MIQDDEKMLQANPQVVIPTFPVRLSQEEIETIGRKRWANTHRLGTQIATMTMLFTAVYALLTFGQLAGPLGRWMILGLVVPLAILTIVGVRDGRAAKIAGREFLKDVQAGRD